MAQCLRRTIPKWQTERERAARAPIFPAASPSKSSAFWQIVFLTTHNASFLRESLRADRRYPVVPTCWAWTDTGISLTSGQSLTINATGSMVFYPLNMCPSGYSCIVGPNGSPSYNPCAGQPPPLVPNLPCLTLIGRIGANGVPFEVGTNYSIPQVSTAGELYLGVNDTYFPDNSQGWNATINQSAKLQGDCSCKYGGNVRVQSPSAGDPIDIATGNVFYQTTDYTTAGQNRLTFTRYYNARGTLSGVPTLAISLGANWRSTYDRYLQISSSTVIAEREDGRQTIFTLVGGLWTPDSDVDETLTQSGSTWTYIDQNDDVETYATTSTGNEALLNSIRARNGQAPPDAYPQRKQPTHFRD